MQLKVIGQSAENYPPLKGIIYKKEPTLKPPKTIMDKATLIRLTVSCLPNQTPPILLKNASDHLRQVKDNNKFKVSDLLFKSAKSNKQSGEFKNGKSGKTQQSPIQQFQQQSSQILYQQRQGSFSFAAIEDLETNRLNTCFNYSSAGIHRKSSSKPYFEELQQIKGSLNEFEDKEYLEEKKDKNINKNKDSKTSKININRPYNCDLLLNQNDKQAHFTSNYNSIGTCFTNQSTDPDEITKQLIKQNLMIFSRRPVIGNQSSRTQANQMKSSNGLQQTSIQTERKVLQSSRDSLRDENTIKSNDQNVFQYKTEAIKNLQESLRSIPAFRGQTQLTPCSTLDKMDISQKDIFYERSSEQTTQVSTVSSAGLAGNGQKNSNILQEPKNDIFERDINITGEFNTSNKLKLQENKRQLIKSSKETERKFKREEQVVSKYEYPIQSKQFQLIDKDSQVKSQDVDFPRKQLRIITPSYLNGCSPLRDLSKKRPQTARIIAYKRLSTVPDKYQDNCEANNFKPTIEIDKQHNNVNEDIFEKEKCFSHRNVRSQSPKEEINRYEQFLCRVLRSERTAVFERIKQNGIVIAKQRNGSQQKLLSNQETQKLLLINLENVDNQEPKGSLSDTDNQKRQEIKNSQENKQEEKQHGKVCPWQEWNEEIGYDEASLDFIHYANSP